MFEWLPEWAQSPALWVALLALLIAVLKYVAPMTETKIDDKLLAFIIDRVKPAVEEKAKEAAAKKAKQVAQMELKKPPPDPAGA
jgi:hypothetical protein